MFVIERVKRFKLILQFLIFFYTVLNICLALKYVEVYIFFFLIFVFYDAKSYIVYI